MALSCLRFEEYRCSANSDCNARADGLCEPSRSCTYPDDDCDSGRRWSDDAVKSAGECMEVVESESDAGTSAAESSGESGSTTDK